MFDIKSVDVSQTTHAKTNIPVIRRTEAMAPFNGVRVLGGSDDRADLARTIVTVGIVIAATALISWELAFVGGVVALCIMTSFLGHKRHGSYGYFADQYFWQPIFLPSMRFGYSALSNIPRYIPSPVSAGRGLGRGGAGYVAGQPPGSGGLAGSGRNDPRRRQQHI
jgi:hypothetical protein